ncbi:hypothetical protein B4070_4417 [Bacillus subtilis]|nr:hypothetical protein B4070_4417 [Bacillus subtilis]
MDVFVKGMETTGLQLITAKIFSSQTIDVYIHLEQPMPLEKQIQMVLK